MSNVHLLKNVSLFAHISDDELESLSREFVAQSVHKGQVVFHQGSTTNSLYIVRAGTIKITSFGRNQEITYVSTREAGEYFGEFSVLDGLPRSGLAEAESNAELLVLTRPAFFRFLEVHPSVSIRLLVTASRRLRFALAAGEATQATTPHAKIINLLVDIAERYSADLAGGSAAATGDEHHVRLGLRMRAEDLASLSGTTTETAISVITDLQTKGAVQLERAYVTAVNLAMLRTMVEAAPAT
jgi:CRP-like cAMP-binding protein